jgi:hypothetical protein
MMQPPIRSSSWNNHNRSKGVILSNNKSWMEDENAPTTEQKRNVTQTVIIDDTPLPPSKQKLLNDMTDEMMY